MSGTKVRDEQAVQQALFDSSVIITRNPYKNIKSTHSLFTEKPVPKRNVSEKSRVTNKKASQKGSKEKHPELHRLKKVIEDIWLAE